MRGVKRKGVAKVGGRSSLLYVCSSFLALAKGKKRKSIGIRYEYSMSERTFVRFRVSENDLSISPKAYVCWRGL